MKEHTRRAVAFIAARLVSRRRSSSVYDYKTGRHFNFSGDADSQRVSVYDYAESCHVSGSGGPNFSLYHYGNSRHINLRVDGESFQGYDYDSSSHFSGRVNGNSVSLYDYGTGSHYNFAA